jgi:hypothetical protein
MMVVVSPETEQLLPLARVLAEIAERVVAEEARTDSPETIPTSSASVLRFSQDPTVFEPMNSPPTKPAA